MVQKRALSLLNLIVSSLPRRDGLRREVDDSLACLVEKRLLQLEKLPDGIS
jgi:hypothetical protein